LNNHQLVAGVFQETLGMDNMTAVHHSQARYLTFVLVQLTPTLRMNYIHTFILTWTLYLHNPLLQSTVLPW